MGQNIETGNDAEDEASIPSSGRHKNIFKMIKINKKYEIRIDIKITIDKYLPSVVIRVLSKIFLIYPSRYYKSEQGDDFKKENERTSGTVFHNMFQLDVYMQAKQNPDGGVLFPGKTCKDLRLCHPDMKSGKYHRLYFCIQDVIR